MNKKRAKSLQLQSVIYGNDSWSIIHSATFTAQALKFAAAEHGLEIVKVFFGDCSPKAALSKADLSTLRKLFGEVDIHFEYVHFKANLGSAGGHNKLASLSDSELLVIANPDIVIQPGAISELYSHLQSNDRIGIAEAKQLPIEHPKSYDKGTLDTSWCSTACALTRRDAFESVGGFDSDTFFLYCDDVDYSWKLRLAGYRAIFVPSAVVFHDKKLDSQADWVPTQSEAYYSAEAALLLTYKWSRGDLTNAISKVFNDSDSPTYQRALDSFRDRLMTGNLPKKLDSKHKVGQFVKGNYAKHRF